MNKIYLIAGIILSGNLLVEIECSVKERIYTRKVSSTKDYQMSQHKDYDTVKLYVDTNNFYASLTEVGEDDFLLNFSYNPDNTQGFVTRGTFIKGQFSTSLVYPTNSYRVSCFKRE